MVISLFAVVVFLLCRELRVGSIACGDPSVGGQEVEFTCKLVNEFFVPNATKIINQREKGPLMASDEAYDWADVYKTKCTAVFIDHCPYIRRALFLTARHCVKAVPGIHFKQPSDIAVPRSWEYLTMPLTKDQVIEHMIQHKFYANLRVSCINSELHGPMRRAMQAYPVELMDQKSNIVQVSKVLQYNSPLDLDIALIWTEVTPEFVHLFKKGGLRPIQLPERGFGPTSIRIPITKDVWYGVDRKHLLKYIVRAGGFGNTDPAECKGDPAFPCFANFAIEQTATHEFLAASDQWKWSSSFWPIDDEQVYAILKPEECERHTKAEHNPAHGLRSTCRGDSGGPAFVVNNGKPILVGIAATGVCTHEEPLPRVIHEIYSKYVLVSSFHVKNWIRGIKDALFHHLPHVDV